MILEDVLIALALGSVFVAIVTGSSLGARDIYFRARDRDASLSALLADQSMFGHMAPYEARADAVSSTSARAIWYGNDRIETDMAVVATGTPSSGSRAERIELEQVSAYPYSDMRDAVGTPLCSADFLHGKSASVPDIAAIQLPVSQTLPLTDLQVRDGVAYVSADSAASADPDILVFDIRDEKSPKLLSSINTGPGISSIAIAGRRIYAAAKSAAAQLHVVRLDSLASPVLEARFKLPLPYATATAPFASSIFYDRSKAYLGTEKWDGDEFDVVDVSDPARPAKIGGLDTGTKINGIYARNGIAYLAGADQYQLRIVDATDPTSPFLLNSFGPSGWQRQEGQKIDLFENALSFGRTSGGFDIPTDFEAFAWATTSLSSLANPAHANDPGGAYGIVADRRHIFLGTRQAGKEFKVFDRSLSVLATYPLPASVQSSTCDNDSIFVLGHTAPIIYRITFN